MEKQKLIDSIVRGSKSVLVSKSGMHITAVAEDVAEEICKELKKEPTLSKEEVTVISQMADHTFDASKAIEFLEWHHKEGYFNTGVLGNGTHYWARTNDTAASTSADLWRRFDQLN